MPQQDVMAGKTFHHFVTRQFLVHYSLFLLPFSDKSRLLAFLELFVRLAAARCVFSLAFNQLDQFDNMVARRNIVRYQCQLPLLTLVTGTRCYPFWNCTSPWLGFRSGLGVIRISTL